MAAQISLLTQFFRQHGGRPKEEFLEEFKGAFLLCRFRGGTPLVVFLPSEEGFQINFGGDEECDLEFDGDPTLDPEHCEVAYHPGFRGWTITDLQTSFGTHVDNDRLGSDRATLLSDRSVIKPGGGLTELQFYMAETLYKRMAKAGITRSLRRKNRPHVDIKAEEAPTQRIKPEEKEQKAKAEEAKEEE